MQMTTEEKIEIIERTLNTPPNTLREDTLLSSLPVWDSFAILSLQIELTAIKPDVQFDDIYMCAMVGDICNLI